MKTSAHCSSGSMPSGIEKFYCYTRLFYDCRCLRRARDCVSRQESNLALKERFHDHPQFRQHAFLEPWIALQPQAIARTRVRQRKKARQIFLEIFDGLRQPRLARFTEIVGLCMAADQKDRKS